MPLEHALVDAIPFLRALPRKRGLEETVRDRLSAFRAAHPDVAIDLVVDQPPSCVETDFDLLMSCDERGTVAVGWRPDGGVPWAVRYSEHWASNLVLTVNDFDLTIQDALLALRFQDENPRDIAIELVDHCLIAAAIVKNPPPVTADELQEAADEFRLGRDLHTVEATRGWLSRSGISIDGLEELLRATVQARKLRQTVTAEEVADYHATHGDALSVVTVCRVHAASASTLTGVAATHPDDFVREALAFLSSEEGASARACVQTGFAGAVLPTFTFGSGALATGALLGPVRHRGEYWCGQILHRFPPRLDGKTRAYIQEQLFQGWLEEQRAKAEIAWHWM